MEGIEYRTGAGIAEEHIRNLYDDAGWTAYTRDLPGLVEAIARSLRVVTAWDNDRLAGLVRVVGDGITIIYIQDLLVLSTHRRKGIGTKLVELVCEEYGGVRQKVLLTDDTPENRAFYTTLGFASCDRGEQVAFAMFK